MNIYCHYMVSHNFSILLSKEDIKHYSKIIFKGEVMTSTNMKCTHFKDVI